MKTIIINAHVISPGVEIRRATVVLERGKIKSVAASKAGEKPSLKVGDTLVDAKGAYLMPGFIDVHTHGALGCDFCDPDGNAIFEVSKAKLQEGVTSYFPTTLTVSRAELIKAAKNAKKYADADMPYAKIPGIHLEGPYINVKCCGAQNPKFVRSPSVKELDAIRKVYPVVQIS